MHAIMTNCMLSVRHHYNTTPVTPCMFSLKCLLTALLRLNRRSHKPQENCLYSECTGRCSLDSVAVQKRFGHSLQAYGLTASCRWICCLRWPLPLKFFWQMSHMNQVPSSCEFSRCVWSWWCHVLKWFYRQSARPRTHPNCSPPTPNYFRHPCMQFLLSLNNIFLKCRLKDMQST